MGGNAPAGDQLSAHLAGCDTEGCCPIDFPDTNTPAVLPFSMAAARCTTSSAANTSANSPSSSAELAKIGEILELDHLDVPGGVLLQDHQIEDPDDLGVDE